MAEPSLSPAAASLFARSQARPFVLPSSYSWWGEVDASREAGAEPTPEKHAAFVNDDSEKAKSSEGNNPREETRCTDTPDGVPEVGQAAELRRLNLLRSHFATASFWEIDTAERMRQGLCSWSSGSAKNAEFSEGNYNGGPSSETEEMPAADFRREARLHGVSGVRDGDSESLASTGSGIRPFGFAQDEILCPVFRLILNHRCNLTLVGKRLCASDLLLRPLAVVHSPSGAQTSDATEPKDRPERKKETGKEGRNGMGNWLQLLAPQRSPTRAADGDRNCGRHSSEDGADSSTASSCWETAAPSSASPGGDGDSLYLRHITLNVLASSAVASRASPARSKSACCQVTDGASSSTSEGTDGSHPGSTSLATSEARTSVQSASRTSKTEETAWGPALSYGLLLVRLEALPEEVRAAVLQASRPFGRLLEDHGVIREVLVDKKLHIHIRRSFFDIGDDAECQDGAIGEGGDREKPCVHPKAPAGCTCVSVLPPESERGRCNEQISCTFGRWSLMLCNGKPAARVLEILNASLLLRAAALDHRHEKAAGNRESKAPAGSVEPDSAATGSASDAGPFLSEEEEAVLEHLSRVCLCSAQECPIHKPWLDIPSLWGPPTGFSPAHSRSARKEGKARTCENSATCGTESCFNCGSALCVEMFQRE
ncbi:conserved hypothetical protein [Neospora caninum Liverpool]|uniref:Uncharacterized protein n=1 Tax=Neospora caninum (strain Liverpool) TaxID=572307 RepID=F0VEJ1_NEOCL|nr:conserved hypothetical protein [Neospora caninum Liverpool]CBZ52135.1 conserved hypothetical protein [Neospora caninum Liverpool]CEL66097.1 TPA: hypothetical protein BN1204_019240 [Neospora caninum Liverpool]|eukprot:XP_003882167.1 conserved hypothetical protein [Neospora caninum Liverpool]